MIPSEVRAKIQSVRLTPPRKSDGEQNMQTMTAASTGTVTDSISATVLGSWFERERLANEIGNRLGGQVLNCDGHLSEERVCDVPLGVILATAMRDAIRSETSPMATDPGLASEYRAMRANVFGIIGHGGSAARRAALLPIVDRLEEAARRDADDAHLRLIVSRRFQGVARTEHGGTGRALADLMLVRTA
jgi:hypothetical protein